MCLACLQDVPRGAEGPVPVFKHRAGQATLAALMVDHSSPREATFIAAGFDTWGGSAFVQARLGLLGKTVFLLAFGFFAVMNALLLGAGGLGILPSLVTQANVMHFLAASVMGALWLIARARPWSLRSLGLLDAGSLLLAGIGLALMAAQPDEKQLMAGLFALAVTMMARAVLIPSTAKRTFCLSWLASAPLLVVSRTVWSIATSSRRTSSSAVSAAPGTSPKSWISASSS